MSAFIADKRGMRSCSSSLVVDQPQREQVGLIPAELMLGKWVHTQTDVYFCGVKTSKIRAPESSSVVIFKLVLLGRVENVMWLTVQDKQHCFVGKMNFVGIQATWESLGDEI